MERSEFDKLADDTLKDLVKRIDKLEIDDLDLMLSDGKLVIEFEDRTTFIVNRQGAAHQMWLAEPQGGWHFDYKDGRWICTKRGVELLPALEDLFSAKLGRSVSLR